MSIQEILTGGGGVLLVLLTLVQISPIEFNPWSALAKVVGRAINADVARELAEIKEKLDGHVTMDDYCADHPEYPNNRAVLAIENIRSNYKERLQKHDFLQEGT